MLLTFVSHSCYHVHIHNKKQPEEGRVYFGSQFEETVKIKHHKNGGTSLSRLGVLYVIYEMGEIQKKLKKQEEKESPTPRNPVKDSSSEKQEPQHNHSCTKSFFSLHSCRPAVL